MCRLAPLCEAAPYDLATGAQLWWAPRDEKPALSTPTLLEANPPQLVTKGFLRVASRPRATRK